MYAKNPTALERLLEHFSLECKEVFESGVQLSADLTIYPTFIFAKGDWPMLRKLGALTRTHARCLAKDGKGKGICHLCLGGTSAFPDWRDLETGSWLSPASIEHGPPPWNRESPVTINVVPRSLSIGEKAWFYRPDLFHTLRKGLLAELTGSAIDFCL